jgi:hypothetical protein
MSALILSGIIFVLTLSGIFSARCFVALCRDIIWTST